jgi:hypothetical protein
MKLNTKASLSIAIAGALNLVSPHVNAVIDLRPDATTTPAKFLYEQSGESTRIFKSVCANNTEFDACDLGLRLALRPSYEVRADRVLFLTVTLNNGVTFAQEPKLACAGQGWSSGAGSWAKASGKIDSGAGYTAATDDGLFLLPSPAATDKSTATFTFPANFTSHAAGGCILTVTGTAAATSYVDFIKGGSTTDKKLTLSTQVSYNSFGSRVTDDSGPLTFAEFVTGYKAEYAAETTASKAVSNKIDVAEALKKFESKTAGVEGFVSVNEIIIGRIAIVSANDLTNVRLMGGTAVSAATNYIESASVTINADILGASNVTVIIASGADCTAGTTATTTGDTSQITIAGLNIEDLREDKGRNVCVKVDGNSTLSPGTTEALLVGTPKEYFSNLNLGIDYVELGEIGINGARTTIYNLPHTDTSEPSFLRLYNTNPSQSMTITGTLYNQDGSVIGTPNSVFAEMGPNEVKVLGSAGLQAAVGATSAWTGRAWLELTADGDSSSLKVQALVRAGNVLVNVSKGADKD